MKEIRPNEEFKTTHWSLIVSSQEKDSNIRRDSLGELCEAVGAGPENTDAQSLQDYYAATKIGTCVRWFGLLLGFACPVLFVLAAFGDKRVFDVDLPADETQFAAIVCGIFCALTFVAAGYVDEFFFDDQE